MMATREMQAAEEAVESARAAGLRYVYDSKPGIRRKRTGKRFRYVGADGKPVRDTETLARIRSLVIPPAWEEVWICANERGHLQATGRDARGRKQSRYHPRWREVRDELKYERMLAFGETLPEIRRRVEQDLALAGLPREKVLATIVRLMETTFIRVGNEEYARENKSYGLTTMRRKHVRIEGATVHFSFQGKSGVRHAIDVNDRRLARIVKRCHDVPGFQLFAYLDAEGGHHTVDSADVNAYLREISGQHFTAKDFRTWAGTVLACAMLAECEAFDCEKAAKSNVVRAIQDVAKRLGNTPAVCRKCYVHPAVLECYLGGSMMRSLEGLAEANTQDVAYALRREECAVMHLLKARASEAA